MKRFLFVSVICSLAGCGSKPAVPPHQHIKAEPAQNGHSAHGNTHKMQHAAMKVEVDPTPTPAKALATLRLTIPDATGKPVKDFAIIHDAKVHLIIIRAGLDSFAHLHPELDSSGGLSARYTFPSGGSYHLFADYQPLGQATSTAIAAVTITGEAPPAPVLASNVPGTVKADGMLAKVSVENARIGTEASIRFELTDEAGQPVTDLEQYMAAMGHLVIVSADAKQYVHAHPSDATAATGRNVVTFQAIFPAPGLYKGWGQFKRAGQVRVVPFVVRIN